MNPHVKVILSTILGGVALVAAYLVVQSLGYSVAWVPNPFQLGWGIAIGLAIATVKDMGSRITPLYAGAVTVAYIFMIVGFAMWHLPL